MHNSTKYVWRWGGFFFHHFSREFVLYNQKNISVCKFSPFCEIQDSNMHCTNQCSFKCSHLNFSLEKCSVYFHNKNSGRTIPKSTVTICWVSALPIQGWYFPSSCFIALQWPDPHIIPPRRDSGSLGNQSTNSARLPSWARRIGNKY